nr:uncharacterized protein LOC113823862 [Penaeus vannamei]
MADRACVQDLNKSVGFDLVLTYKRRRIMLSLIRKTKDEIEQLGLKKKLGDLSHRPNEKPRFIGVYNALHRTNALHFRKGLVLHQTGDRRDLQLGHHDRQSDDNVWRQRWGNSVSREPEHQHLLGCHERIKPDDAVVGMAPYDGRQGQQWTRSGDQWLWGGNSSYCLEPISGTNNVGLGNTSNSSASWVYDESERIVLGSDAGCTMDRAEDTSHTVFYA